MDVLDRLAITYQITPQGTYETWKSILSALQAAAAISRMFDFNPAKKSEVRDNFLRQRRSMWLRRVLGIASENKYINVVRLARNSCEHFEEYFDVELDFMSPGMPPLLDLTCMTEEQVEEYQGEVLRWYDPSRRVIHIFDEFVKLEELRDIWRELIMLVNTGIFLRGRYHLQWSFGLRGIDER